MENDQEFEVQLFISGDAVTGDLDGPCEPVEVSTCTTHSQGILIKVGQHTVVAPRRAVVPVSFLIINLPPGVVIETLESVIEAMQQQIKDDEDAAPDSRA